MAKIIEVESMSDELAKSIRQIGAAMEVMQKSGLKQRTIVVLLKDYLGQSIKKDDIESVLRALNNLEKNYLEPRK